MDYTYKPTANAIRYTGDFNKVFDFIEGNVTRFEWINNDLQSHINIKTDNGVAVSTLRLGDYLVKETFDDGKIEYKTMDEDEFKRYYKKVTPKSLEQAVCDTTESAADTTPVEDKPERSGRVDYSENYYYIGSFGEISCTSDLDTYMDIARYEFGNYFHTEEEAIQARDERLLQLKYRQWRKQHDPVVLDWRDGNQQKWFLYYDYGEDDMNYTSNYSCRRIGALYFSATDLAEQFYNEHKDLIHRVLGVE